MNMKRIFIDLLVFIAIQMISPIAAIILVISNIFSRLNLSTKNQSVDDFIKLPNYYFERIIDFIIKFTN